MTVNTLREILSSFDGDLPVYVTCEYDREIVNVIGNYGTGGRLKDIESVFIILSE